MFSPAVAHLLLWSISILSIVLMLIRPRGIPEVVWVVAGASLLVALRLVPVTIAGHAIAEGTDVYLFLTGMMLLSELARFYGVFDWLANRAVENANGSRQRLFALIYGVGTIVTIFMSNDATAVVLTPAVLTAVKRSRAEPLPYLFVCALIANAASFVLPISNPANLVVFHSGMPPLLKWLAMFSLPSVLSIGATYLLLHWYFRRELEGDCQSTADGAKLSPAGKVTLFGILAVAVVLLVASALKKDLGLPTCLASLVIAGIVCIRKRQNPWALVREISWSVLPLVAALFVVVEATKAAGALRVLEHGLRAASQWPIEWASLATGLVIGLGTNLTNNLPLGLLAGAAVQEAHVHELMTQAALIGVDLGPNLSITGSLATILWLIALRREGLYVSGWQFFKAGLVIMPPALLLAVGATLVARMF
jgi:arsenical pump membrane protein